VKAHSSERESDQKITVKKYSNFMKISNLKNNGPKIFEKITVKKLNFEKITFLKQISSK